MAGGDGFWLPLPGGTSSGGSDPAGTPAAGTPQTLVSNSTYAAFPVGVRCANGDLLVAYSDGPDHTNRDDDALLLRSVDEGETWSTAGTVVDTRPSALEALSSGVLLLGAWDHSVTGQNSNSRRSTDNGATWATPVDIEHPFTDWVAVESFAELPNGDVLAFSYGENTGDTLNSVSQCRSTDGGQTWTDEGVIFSGPSLSKHMQEPQVVCLDDGSLLALLRSDTGTKTHHTATSTDNGATWSTPAAAFVGTGRPSVHQAPDGTVLVMYRSNTAPQPSLLRASTDNGATWGDAEDFTGSTLKFEYGAFMPLASGATGAVYALEQTANVDSDIYYVELATVPSSSLVTLHNDLLDRGVEGAHPISAITGLQDALDAAGTGTVDADDVRDAGRWEVLVTGTPAAAVTTEDETDWLYGWVTD